MEMGQDIADAYEKCDFARAMRLIMSLADWANRYIENWKPWEEAKKLNADRTAASRVQVVCTIGLNLFRQLAIYLAPVLPKLAQQTGELLGDPIVSWEQSQHRSWQAGRKVHH